MAGVWKSQRSGVLVDGRIERLTFRDAQQPGGRAIEQPRLGLRRLALADDGDGAAGQWKEGGEGVHGRGF
jgi:hypothetical protein